MTPDVNLEKLVPLEVHGRLRNAKIAKKYFPMLERGVPYAVGKLKRRAFQLAKEHANWIPGQGDTAPRSPGTKSREFPGVSQSDPHDPRRGPTEGCKSICMEGGISHFGSAVVNPLPRVSRRTANPNCKP